MLGRFIPDFGRIVAMMQFNMYHHYTVDEHLIRAVGILAEIERGDVAERSSALDRDHQHASRTAARSMSRSSCTTSPRAAGGSFDRRRAHRAAACARASASTPPRPRPSPG